MKPILMNKHCKEQEPCKSCKNRCGDMCVKNCINIYPCLEYEPFEKVRENESRTSIIALLPVLSYNRIYKNNSDKRRLR